jgi:predicted alpha-1,2-mannosidase
MKHQSLLIILACCALVRTVPAQSEADKSKLVEYVNILQGTDSTPHFSHGNTLPLVGMPWGMVDWSLQNGDRGWFFSPNGRVDGIRATHQPSPWMGDYAFFVLMPQAGDLRMDVKARAQEYDMNAAILHPDYEKIDLKQDAITMELAGTERCGVFRFTYHTGTTGRLILDGADKSKVDLRINGRTIYGRTPNKKFPSYFVVKLDRDIIKSEILKEEISQAATPKSNATLAPKTTPPPKATVSGESRDVRGYVEFLTKPTEPVLVKVGTSFISLEQAEQNLRTETEGTFEAIHDRVAAVWNANLGKIEITATEDQKKTFYTCLYRAQMFPHRIYELDAAGKTIHYSPYDGKIHDGVLYAGIGVWDGFRTTFPFLTLVYPSQLDSILQGFVGRGEGTASGMAKPRLFKGNARPALRRDFCRCAREGASRF